MVDVVWNETEQAQAVEQNENESDRTTLLTVPNATSGDNRRESLLSPRRAKHVRGINGK